MSHRVRASRLSRPWKPVHASAHVSIRYLYESRQFRYPCKEYLAFFLLHLLRALLIFAYTVLAMLPWVLVSQAISRFLLEHIPGFKFCSRNFYSHPGNRRPILKLLMGEVELSMASDFSAVGTRPTRLEHRGTALGAVALPLL